MKCPGVYADRRPSHNPASIMKSGDRPQCLGHSAESKKLPFLLVSVVQLYVSNYSSSFTTLDALTTSF